MLRSHDLANILVGTGRFFKQLTRPSVIKPHSFHLLFETAYGDRVPRFASAHPSSCTVRTRAQRLFTTAPLNVKAWRAHGTRYEPRFTLVRGNGALAMDPELTPRVLLLRHSVVVAIYERRPLGSNAGNLGTCRDRSFEHGAPTGPGECQRPAHIVEIGLTFR